MVVARAVAARAPDALAPARGAEAIGDAAERAKSLHGVRVVRELGSRRERQRDAVVVLVAVPPRRHGAHPIREAASPGPRSGSAPRRLRLRTLQEMCSKCVGRSPRRRRIDGLHAAEELVDVAAGRLDLQRAVDAGLAVVDAAEHRAAGGGEPLRGGLERRRVGDLERQVLVAAVGAVLDEDQLVVAVVAGQVGRRRRCARSRPCRGPAAGSRRRRRGRRRAGRCARCG